MRNPNNGEIIGYNFNGVDYDSKPMTLFYNWIYCNALNAHPEYVKEIVKYDYFTDIKLKENSYNCQAEACAVFVSLYRIGKLDEALSSIEKFKELVYGMPKLKDIKPSSIIKKEEKVDAPKVSVGAKIFHKAFGEGMVEAVDGLNIKVNFGKVGIKKLNLEVIGKLNLITIL